MGSIVEKLTVLSKKLSKHSSVKSIYKIASEKELDSFLSSATDDVFKETWESLIINTYMIIGVKGACFDKDEDKSTKEVLECIDDLYDFIKKDKSYDSKVFSTKENRELLINASSMINMFCINNMKNMKIQESMI